MENEQKETREVNGNKPASRSDEWKRIRATLHNLVDTTGDVYAELVLRGHAPNLQIRYTGGTDVDMLITCPIMGELDRTRLAGIMKIAELFRCEMELVQGPSQEAPFGVVFYDFYGGEDEQREEKPESEEKEKSDEDSSGDNSADVQPE